jgi:magnesium transporter
MSTTTSLRIEDLELAVQEALERNDLDTVRGLLAGRHAADVADVIDRLDDDEQVLVFGLLENDQAADVLGETGIDATRELIEQMPIDQAADLLDLMPMDDVAEILSEDVPERLQALLLQEMEPDDAAEVRLLLQYPPQTAGRLMTGKYVHVTPDLTVAQVLTLLRQVDAEIESFNDVYVLNEQRQLIGILSLRKIISASPTERVDSLMMRMLITALPETDQEEVARIVSQYDLLALPIVDGQGRMLGIVTIDDVVDVLVEESNEDVLRFGGVGSANTDENYFSVSLFNAVRRRIVWLMLLFLAGTLTSSVVQLFEGELSKMIILSSFIPLIIGTGGNTGAQTVSTVIRGLALGDIRWADTWRVLLRELRNGLVLGLLLGLIGFVWVFIWGNGLQLSLVIGLSVVAICIWSNTIGSLVPLVAQKLGIDPATVSAPLITTLVDATGLAIYLFIAKIMLGL